MPQFKSTYNILKVQDEDEAYDKRWFEYDHLILPPSKEWDYARELKVEDVDYWEVLYEASGGIALYASWDPYAEFYLLCTGFDLRNPPRFLNGKFYYDRNIETFYGSGALEKVKKRAREVGILLWEKHIWVEDDKMWLYTNQE